MQHVEALRVLARGLLLLGIGLLLLAPLAVDALVGGQRLGDVGVVAIEQVELILLLQEGEVLVLPVDVDEIGANLAQDGQCDVAAVDERCAAARPRELPRDDELFVRVVDGLLRQELVQAERLVLEREYRLNAQPVAARAHHVGRHARAEHGAERVDEDRLARAGLAGQDIEARLELHLHVLEQCEVPDRQ